VRSSILLLVFNRPESTRRVMESIRAARPPRLYVAADGARPGRAGEAQRCAEVRAIAMGRLDSIREVCDAPAAQGAFYFLLKLRTRRDAMEIVERLIREHGVAVLLVEQNALLALKVADRAYVLDDGRIVHGGAAKDLGADRERIRMLMGLTEIPA